MSKVKEVFRKILGGFKIGDRVKIIGYSTYKSSPEEGKKYLGKRGIITGVFVSPENEKFFIVEILDTQFLIDEYFCREEDLEYDIKDEGNGSSPMRDSHLQMRDSLCGSPK